MQMFSMRIYRYIKSNAYAVSDENTGYYFELGEVDPNGKTQKKLNEIAEQYNIEIIVIESINDLS